MPHKLGFIAVLDIGKTNVKLHLLDAHLHSVQVESLPNTVVTTGRYAHYDVARIWDWLTGTLRKFSETYPIGAINVSAHGATAALIDSGQSSEMDGLVLPILDYEFDGPETVRPEYDQFRADFSTTFSPKLPGGLNLGAQLFWLEQSFRDQFLAASHILLYPQYWVWRMAGTLCSEVTSLGCHTDLWCPDQGSWSSLAQRMGWAERFPPLTSAWRAVSTIQSGFAELTGLDLSCKVFPGIHDSNASFARYLGKDATEPFSVVSTGTWAIAMASGSSLGALKAERDMLANVDANGRPVACARSMGGREFGEICRRLGVRTDAEVKPADISRIFEHKTLALPDFSGGSGPFGGHDAQIINAISDINGAALATIYAALMIDLKLELLHAGGDIFIEGPFADNRSLCALLAQLRPEQRVFASGDKTGTVIGCAQLMLGVTEDPAQRATRVTSPEFAGLAEYRTLWRESLPGIVSEACP